jgi:anti-sigma factor RsiW
MICEDARAFLQDYADRTLSEAARATVERHLAGCDVCAADLKALGYVDEKLRAQPVLPTPPGLVDRIMVRVFPTSKPSFGREILRFAAAAAILAALTVGTLSLDLRGLVGERTSRLVQEGLTPIEGAVDRIDGLYRGLTEE